jgi:predicted dehydrogenase
VIGTGLAVERLHWPVLDRLRDAYEVVAFTNHTKPKAERFSSFAGVSMDRYCEDIETLLKRDDVEAVLISLPIPMNYPVTKMALEAGKHVICEKPAGVNLEEGRAFLELEAAHPERVVLITENSFYRDDARLARSMIDDGAIGRVHLASWRMVSQLIPREGQFSSTPWRHSPGYAGGPHLDAGVHHTAIIRLLCGDANMVHGLTQDANDTHGGPSDLILSMRFVSGAIGHYTASWPEIEVPREENALRLYGTGGVMTVGYGEIVVEQPGKPRTTHRPDQFDGGHFNAFVNFHEAVRYGEPVLGTVEQTYRNMELVLEALASAEEGAAREITFRADRLRSDALPLWRSKRNDPLFDDSEYVSVATDR